MTQYRWGRYKEIRAAIDQHEGGMNNFTKGKQNHLATIPPLVAAIAVHSCMVVEGLLLLWIDLLPSYDDPVHAVARCVSCGEGSDGLALAFAVQLAVTSILASTLESMKARKASGTASGHLHAR